MNLHWIVITIILLGLVAMILVSYEEERRRKFKSKDVNIEWDGNEVDLKSKNYPLQDFHHGNDFRYKVIHENKK